MARVSNCSRRTFLILAGGASLKAGAQDDKMFADAQAYERFMGRWSEFVAPLLIDFAKIPDHSRVLDIGSGTGSLSFAIARFKRHVRVTGVDLSPEYVAYATKQNRYPGVRFETGDAQKLKFSDASFEACLSLLVMNFIPRPEQALTEMRRVTKPNGKIAAAVWDYGDGMRMLRVFWDAAVAVDPSAERVDEKHMPLCRVGELKELWKRGGLEEVEERPLEIEMQFRSFDDYWSPFLLGQGPAGAYVKGLSKERVAALRSEVERRLHLTSQDAPFRLAARAWAVRGSVPGSMA